MTNPRDIFRFAIGEDCCGESCVYFRDEFDRDDSTNLGGDWSEVAGDWAIDGQKLVTSSDNAICTCTRAHPSAPSNQLWVVAYVTGVTGDQVRLIGNYVDGDNYHFLEVEWGAVTGTAKLYRRSGGSDTLLDSTSGLAGLKSGETYGVYLRLQDCRVSSSGGDSLTETLTSAVAGVGTNSTGGQIQIDNFALEETAYTQSGCPTNCECLPCTPGTHTPRMQADVQGMAGGGCCGDVDGTYVMVEDPTWYCKYWLVVDICGVGRIRALLGSEGGFYVYHIALDTEVDPPPAAPGDLARFKASTGVPYPQLGGPVHCVDDVQGIVGIFVNQDGGFPCDASGATVTLTALP